jgi:inorganic pyrophosphatase
MKVENIFFGTVEAFNVFIEITKGSPKKYEYDEESQTIKLDFVFRDGFVFAYNYGLIPETKAPDGDHLDAIVLSDNNLAMDTIVVCRAIGMIELLDRGIEDNKIIAVSIDDENYKDIQSINDLPKSWFSEMEDFFKGIAIQKNKTMEIKSFQDKGRALFELNKCRINLAKE